MVTLSTPLAALQPLKVAFLLGLLRSQEGEDFRKEAGGEKGGKNLGKKGRAKSGQLLNALTAVIQDQFEASKTLFWKAFWSLKSCLDQCTITKARLARS